MKVLPCDLFGQVILRPRWRYIYSTFTYIYIYIQSHTQKACIHIVRNHKWAEGACRGDWICVSLTTSTTPRSCYCVLPKGPWSFSALILFSYIFLLSHTFVDILCCLEQMYVRDQLSVVWSCSPLLVIVLFSFSFSHSTAGLCSVSGVCWALIGCLVMLYPHCIWSHVRF